MSFSVLMVASSLFTWFSDASLNLMAKWQKQGRVALCYFSRIYIPIQLKKKLMSCRVKLNTGVVLVTFSSEDGSPRFGPLPLPFCEISLTSKRTVLFTALTGWASRIGEEPARLFETLVWRAPEVLPLCLSLGLLCRLRLRSLYSVGKLEGSGSEGSPLPKLEASFSCVRWLLSCN